jgi:CHAD domain-containing protein
MSRDHHIDATTRGLSALRRGMRAVDGFTVVLLRLVDDVDRHWVGASNGDDADALHDLRVALRRTRCVLREGRRVLPTRVVATARAEFHDLADLTGPPRDFDVLLAGWAQYTSALGARDVAAIERVRTIIDAQRTAAHEALAAGFDGAARIQVDEWRTQLGTLLSGGATGDHANRRLGTVIARRVLRSHERLIEHGRFVQHDSPDVLLHDLRKEAKILRYLVECFDELFADEPRRALLTGLKGVQEVLGVHQDAVAHHAVIATALGQVRRPSTTTRHAVDAVLRDLERRRDECRIQFATQFAEFDSKPMRAALQNSVRRLER